MLPLASFFWGTVLVSSGLVSKLLAEVSALLVLIQESSLTLLHQNPTKVNIGLHNLWDLILGLNAFFCEDQQQTSKALEEKAVMPMCTNPKPTFSYFL